MGPKFSGPVLISPGIFGCRFGFEQIQISQFLKSGLIQILPFFSLAHPLKISPWCLSQQWEVRNASVEHGLKWTKSGLQLTKQPLLNPAFKNRQIYSYRFMLIWLFDSLIEIHKINKLSIIKWQPYSVCAQDTGICIKISVQCDVCGTVTDPRLVLTVQELTAMSRICFVLGKESQRITCSTML